MNKVLTPLSIALQAQIPVVVIGGPGVGKTSALNAMALNLDYPIETVIASLREPSDFAGLPVVSNGQVSLAAPSWAKRLSESNHPSILFLDEISTAPPATQAALLRVILDRVVGDMPLGEHVSIVAAMNPPEVSAGGWELSPPLANRFCHLQWSVQSDDWIAGMLQGFPQLTFPRLPDTWLSGLPESRAHVAAFIQHKPHALYQCPKTDTEQGKPWPSPRSWYMVAVLQCACRSVGVEQDVSIPLIAGCIGEGMALEYVNWLSSLDLPDPEMLLKNPDSFVVPERGDVAYTVLVSVAVAACQNLTKARNLAAWQIFGKCASEGKKDIAAASVKMLAIEASKKGFMADADVRKAMVTNLAPFKELLGAAGLLLGGTK